MPSTKDDLAITYTPSEVIIVETDDGTGVDMEGLAPIYLIHQFKLRHDNNHDTMTIQVKAKSSLDFPKGFVYLQVWNTSTLAWETIAVDEITAAKLVVRLEGVVSKNLVNYYDEVSDKHFPFVYNINEVAFRIYQFNSDPVP